jgi:hypothetical protein
MNTINPLDVTVFLIETGEPSFKKALEALNAQTVKVRIKIISNVTPMWRAFQRMIDECETRYFVQVDADMILKPTAVSILMKEFAKQPKSCCMYVGWLFDTDMQRNILGVKIYDNHIFKHFPYRESFSCEVFQLASLKRFGFTYEVSPLISAEAEAESLGQHSPSQTPAMAFARWERNMLKFRELGYDYLSIYPNKMLERFKENPTDSIVLAQFLGCVSGLVCEIDLFRELDATKKNKHFEILDKLLSLAKSTETRDS